MADDIIDRLLRIQDQDLRIVDMERELAALPERGKKLENELNAYHAAITAAQEQRKAAQLDVKRLEMEDQEHRQKISRLREQQMTLKTNREFRTMEEEIAVVQLRIGQLETRLLESMETVDSLSLELDGRKKELKQAEQAIEKEKEVLIARGRQVEDELEELRNQRKIAATSIPETWLSAYDRLFKGKRDRVLVSVENGICGGCHMKLPPAVTHSARRAESMVTCDFCGRMLYSDHRMT